MGSVLFLYPEVSKKSLAQEYIDKYIRNTLKFTKIEAKPFKTPSSGDAVFKKKKETDAILKLIDSKDLLILFDEKGETLSSREFAGKINNQAARLVFIIGGPYGFDSLLYERAWKKISLSSLTFNSEVASVVASEQIFRIHSINAGHPYHND